MRGKNRAREEHLGEEQSQSDCNRQNSGLNTLVLAIRGGHARQAVSARVFFTILLTFVEIND